VSLSVHRQRQPAALSSVCPSGVAIRVTTVRRHDELCAIRANVMRRINRASAFGGGEYPERLDILAPIWVESLGVAHFNKCQKRPASAATCSRNHDIRPGEGDRPARPRWRREQPTDPRTSRRLGALKSPSAGSALVTAYYRRLQPSNRSAWAWAGSSVPEPPAWRREAPPPLDRGRATRTMSYGVDEYETPALARMGGEARRHSADDAQLVVSHHDGGRRDHEQV
jgi:hypothetical protein